MFSKSLLTRAVSAVSMLAFIMQWLLPAKVFANPLQNQAPVNLDLSSTHAAYQAGTVAGFHPLSIMVGHQPVHIGAGTMLTPAELAAVQQVLSTGHQTLILAALGSAAGGTLSLGGAGTPSLDGLVIPHGVLAVDRLASTQQLDVSGTLKNAGTLSFSPTGGTHASSVVNAVDVVNLAGGLIKSSTGLNLTATDALINHGFIQALGNLSIATPNLINNGTIRALAGDVTVQGTNGSLNIQGTGGTIQAAAGNINLLANAASTASGITLSGGDYLSRQLNIDVANGTLNALLDHVSGLVNINAACSHFGAATPDLRLGTLNVTGDPTYFNTGGSLSLSSVSVTSGNDLALVASGDVIVSGGALDTSSSTGNGGSLFICAGCNVAPSGISGNNDTTTTLTITQGSGSAHGSATGGAIDVSGVSGINTTSTASGDFNGGNVTMVAFAGSGVGSSLTPGTINLGSANVKSYGAGSGTGGTVYLLAGATSDPSGGHAINSTGTIQTGENAGGGIFYQAGPIDAITATPNIAGPISVFNGTATNLNNISFGATLQPASIALGTLYTSSGTPASFASNAPLGPTAPSAGNVTIEAGTNISVGPVFAFGAAASQNTGTGAAASGGSGGIVNLFAGNNIVFSGVQASGGAGGFASGSKQAGGAGGVGGTVNITSMAGNITDSGASSGPILVGGGGGSSSGSDGKAGGDGGGAGSVQLTASVGSVSVPFIDASGGGGAGGSGGYQGGAGGNGGNGGTVSVSAQKVDIQYFINASAGGGGGAGGADAANGNGAAGGAGGSGFAAGASGSSASSAVGGGGGAGGYFPSAGGYSQNTAGSAASSATLSGGNGADGSNGTGGAGGAFGQGGAGGDVGNLAGADAGGAGGGMGSAGTQDRFGNNLAGSAGQAGSITLTGNRVTVDGSLATGIAKFKGADISSAPHASDSLLALGPHTGGPAVSVTTTSATLASQVYSSDFDLSSTNKYLKLSLLAGTPFSIGSLTKGNGTFGKIEAGSIQINNSTGSGVLSNQSIASKLELSITEWNSGTPSAVNFFTGLTATLAEVIALSQVSATGTQTIFVDSTGALLSGSQGTCSINPVNLPLGGFTAFTVPSGIAITASVPSLTILDKTSSVSIASAGSLSITGSGSITGSSIVIDGTLSATGTLSLTSLSGITGLGSISSDGSLSLIAKDGDIAQSTGSTNSLQISCGSLSISDAVVSSGAAGNVYVQNSAPSGITTLNLLSVTAPGIFQLFSNTDISVNQAVSATGNVVIASSGGTGDSISVGANIISAGTIVIQSDGGTGGIASISQTAGLIQAPGVGFFDTGTGGITVGTGGKTGGLLNTGNLSITSGGNVAVTDQKATQLTCNITGSLTFIDALGVVSGSSGISIGSGTITTPFIQFGTNDTVTNGSLVIQSPVNESLTIEGGTLSESLATASLTLTSSVGPLIFSNNCNLTVGSLGVATFNALNDAVSITNGITVTINGNLAIDASAVFNPTGLSVSGTASFTDNGSSNPGTGFLIQVGNLNLSTLSLQSANNGNLVVAATGNITDVGLTNITLKESNGSGGSLTLLAGFNAYASPLLVGSNKYSAKYTFSPSANGGSINLGSTTISMSSMGTGSAADAGDVVLVASGGTASAGNIVTGGINTSSTHGFGGNVTLAATGGVLVNGAITANGALGGGNVIIYGFGARLNNAAAYFGMMNPLATYVNAPITGGNNGASVLVNSINTSSSSGAGGFCNLITDTNVTAGIITTTGATAAGSVNIQSLNPGFMSIGAVNANGASTSLGVVGDGGSGANLNVTNFAGLTIGSINLSGGSANLLGNGGNAGQLSVQSYIANGAWTAGSMLVQGSINLSGGNTSSHLTQLTGGEGGSASIVLGTLRVTGTTFANGVSGSILANGGTRVSNLYAGSGIAIHTIGVQLLPANFNLLSSLKSEVALPGAIFSVGNSSINGSAGSIYVGGQVANSHNANKLTTAAPFTSAALNVIPTAGQSDQINLNGTSTTIAPWSKITPSESVALYQVSTGQTQAVGLTSLGQLAPLNSSAAPNSITAGQGDVPQYFSNFVLAATAIPNNVIFVVSGNMPTIDLSKAAAISISGTFGFANFSLSATNGVLNIGAKSIVLNAGSQLSASTLYLESAGGRITNSGSISASTALTLVAPGGFALVNNALGALGGSFNLPVTGMPSTLTLTNGQGQFNAPITIGPVPVALFNAAASGMTFGSGPTSSTINVSLIGSGSVPGTATFGGTIDGTTLAHFTINASNDTALSFTNTANYSPSSSFTIHDSAGGVSLNSARLGSGGSLSITAASWQNSSGFLNANSVSITTTVGTILDSAGTWTTKGLTVSSPAGIGFDNSSVTVSGNGTVTSLTGIIAAQSSTISATGTLMVNGVVGVQTTSATLEADKGLTVKSLGNLNDNSGSSFNSTTSTVTIQASGISLGANTTATSHGALSITDTGSALLFRSSNTLSGSSVSISSYGDFQTSTTNINALSGIKLTSLTGAVSFSGNAATTAGTLLIQAGNNVSINGTLKSGTLNGVPGAGVLTSADIATKGSITITAGSLASPGCITLPNDGNTTINSIGGNTTLTAYDKTNGVNLGSINTLRADGGNLVVLTLGPISASVFNPGTGNQGNQYVARAVGSTTSSTGGGIEFGAGTTASRLAAAFLLPAGTHPSVSLGSSVVINNNGNRTGVVQANISLAGTVNLSATTSTTLNLDQNSPGHTGGAIVFDAQGKPLTLDGSTLDVEGYVPIAYTSTVAPREVTVTGESAGRAALANVFLPGRQGAHRLSGTNVTAGKTSKSVMDFQSGQMFLNPVVDVTIKCALGQIHANKGALLAITADTSGLRVAACSGPGAVTVSVAGTQLRLMPGEEVFVSNSTIEQADTLGDDGIGRRGIRAFQLGKGTHVAICDFSIITMIANSEHLHSLIHPNTVLETRIREQLLRTAAAVQTVTRNRGAYTASRAQLREVNRSHYTPVGYIK